jgi:hypothetical protein
VRLSNVFVCEGSGPDDLRITAPANSRIEDVPASAVEPDSYRLIKKRGGGPLLRAATDAAALGRARARSSIRSTPTAT